MNYQEFNLNNHILVKLKDDGYKIWRERWNRHLPEDMRQPITYFTDRANKDGYVYFQAHEFMRIFGEHLTIGFHQPFEMTILIPEE